MAEIIFRLLTNDELELFSDCSKHTEKSGNLINTSADIKVDKRIFKSFTKYPNKKYLNVKSIESFNPR